MKKPKIITHCLVKNEERFIWYAINSVLPFVDKIMVWDTGSEDKTVEIIKTIKSPKIEFKEVGSVDKKEFTIMRDQMLQKTSPREFDWLMILDGDEIWPSKAIKLVRKHIISEPQTQAIFVKTTNAVGDIYHKKPQTAGHYKIKGVTGHLGLRFINLKNVHHLHVDLPYGREGYYSRKLLVQDLPRVAFVDTSYFHATHLTRSTCDRGILNRNFKSKFELGETNTPTDLPEVFFLKHPHTVPEVTQKINFITWLISLIATLPKWIKRAIVIY